MYILRLKEELTERCAIMPANEWRLLGLLLRGEADAGWEFFSQLPEDHAESVAAAWQKYGLCGWWLDACPALGEAAVSPWHGKITHAANREFAACAQRKLALMQLDELAGKTACSPIVFKGAANAATYYPKESLRPSHDVDLMLPPEEIARFVPEHAGVYPQAIPFWCDNRHLEPFTICGYPVELHEHFIAQDRWGRPEHLADDSLALPGYAHLRQPSPETALTVALLHFSYHVGYFTFDFHDMARIVKAPDFSWDTALELWRRENIASLVLPSLAVGDALLDVVPGDTWKSLWSELNTREKAEVLLSIKLLKSSKFEKLRRDWFSTRLSKYPVWKPLMRRVAGSKSATEEATGRASGTPLFWYYHFLALPAKRVFHFWR